MTEEYKCSDCNHILDDVSDANHCSNCGASWDEEIPKISVFRKLIAVLAAISACLVAYILIGLGTTLIYPDAGQGTANILAGIIIIVSIYLFKIVYFAVRGDKRIELPKG